MSERDEMSRRDEVVTGLFVLLGTAVILAGALWLSESRWRADYRTVEARFPTVGQLQTGSTVTFRGVQVGRVQEIQVAASGVRVVMRVERDVDLPERLVAVARPVSMFGEWSAALEPAERHPDAAEGVPRPGEGEIRGVTASDFAQLSDYAGEIANNLETITDRIEVAFNEETARDLARSVQNFEQASSELVTLLSQQRKSMGQFSRDLSESGRTLREVAANLDSTVARLEAATEEDELQDILENTRRATASLDTLAGSLNVTAGQVRSTVARADSAVRRAEGILSGIEEGRGSLGRLARDPVLYENLSLTLAELRALLDDLKRNPAKYFKFSIF